MVVTLVSELFIVTLVSELFIPGDDSRPEIMGGLLPRKS